MREFAKAVADDQLGLDAKLPRTLSALFFRPGLLTTEYMAGRIARYVPPFRLYLITSVLFFVMLSFLSRSSDWAETAGREIEAQQAADTLRDTTRSGLKVGVSIRDEQWIDSINVNLPWPWLDRKIESNLEALGKLPPNVALRRTWESMIEELPKVMFLLLPVFALLFKLIYVRRKRFYIEHFVFALHVHAFAFALFLVGLVLRADWLTIAFTIVMAVYLLLAMKRVYGQGWFKTSFKWFAVGSVYSVLLIFGALMAAILALAAASA